MAFQDKAYSLASRLHYHGLKPPVIAGIVALAVVALGFAGYAVYNALCVPVFSVSQAEASQETSEVVSVEPPIASCIVVHVSGCVMAPGVYELPTGARVNDAVLEAGGFTEEADQNALNLARTLMDAEHVIVPAIGSSATEQAQSDSAQTESATKSSGIVNGLVNINTADVTQLSSLSGIGESTAQKIIADREANGPFSSIEDLKRVSGIGDKKYASISGKITVG